METKGTVFKVGRRYCGRYEINVTYHRPDDIYEVIIEPNPAGDDNDVYAIRLRYPEDAWPDLLACIKAVCELIGTYSYPEVP